MSRIVEAVVSPISLISRKAGRVAIAAGLIVAGAVTGNFALIGAGLSLGAQQLKGSPQTSPADRDRLNASINPRTPRKMVFGETAMATDILDQEFTDNERFLHRFVVVAAHEVESIDEIWFDDKLAWTSTGGVIDDEYDGFLTVATRTVGTAANAINISPRMGSSRRYTGLAYVHFRYDLTSDNSPFSQAIPSRLTIRGKGWKTYDPRKDSTKGGSGTHRIDNQSTWEYDPQASRNPFIQELNYLLGWHINGVLSVGRGLPPERINIDSYIDAANIADEAITLAAGGSEPRYRTDGIFSEADNMSLVLEQFKSSSNSEITDFDGQLRAVPLVNELGTPVASFTADDIIGNVDWDLAGDIEDRINIVRGTFTDPSDEALYQSVDYPQQAIANVDGVDRILPVDYPLVQSDTNAQRLAFLRLQRAQYPEILRCEMKATAWRVQQYDVIELTFPFLRMSSKKFRVLETSVRIDGTVPMLLQEENAAIYAWDEAELARIQAVANSTYTNANNPNNRRFTQLNDNTVKQAINNSFPIDLAGNVTQADSGSGDVTVTIPNHQRNYGGFAPSVNVMGGTFIIDYETTNYFYYDDATISDQTPNIQSFVLGEAGTVAADAFPSVANPYRHFLFVIVAQASDGTGGSTAGAGPPGAGGWTGDDTGEPIII